MFKRLLGISLLVFPMAVRGQGGPAAARSFLAAHSRGDWAAMAAQVDSPSLAVVRAEATRLVESISQARGFSNRMRADSARAPAMLQMMQGLESTLGPNLIAVTFARVDSAPDLAVLSDRELMSRWFEAKSPANMMRMGRAMVGGIVPPEAIGAMDSAMAAMAAKPIPWEVVGELTDQAGQSHVIYRAGGETPGATSVLTFKRTPRGTWLLSFSRTDDQLATFASYTMRALMPSEFPGIR